MNTKVIEFWHCNNWRDCKVCFDRRKQRLKNQILEELNDQQLYVTIFDNNISWKRVRDRWQKRRVRGSNVRFCGYPVDDSIIVIHNQYKESDDLLKRTSIDVLIEQISNTPPNMKIRPIRNNWGGAYAGAKGWKHRPTGFVDAHKHLYMCEGV